MKRDPITSPTSAIRIMQGANREIAPPGHVRLQDEDWPFWHSVLAEFARAEWTDHQLELAAFLARDMANRLLPLSNMPILLNCRDRPLLA